MNVSEFKNHPLFPFADFRTNDESFLLLELFWTQVVREGIGDELFYKCQPIQEIQRDIGDEPFYSPIMVDFRIPDIDRGGRIILTENYDSAPLMKDATGDDRFRVFYPFVFYLNNKFMEDGHQFMQIACCSDMADGSIASTQYFLREILVNQISEETIDAMIEKELEELKNYRIIQLLLRGTPSTSDVIKN